MAEKKKSKSDFSQKLTREQKAAIQCFWHKTENMLLSAGAGSGKTYTIIQSLLYAAQIQIDFNKIFIITFTVKAAEELKNRLAKENLYPSFTGTIHALGLKILKNLRPKEKLHILNDADSIKNKLLKKMYPEYSMIPEDLIFQSLSDEEKDNFLYKYKQYKKENQWIDFDDMISFFKEYEKLIATFFSNKIIIVDEYQDTSFNQVEFIKWLNPSKLMAVGDARQSIYRFRGADLENFYRFPQHFKPSCMKRLSYNFRSGKKILHFANFFIKKSASKDRNKLKAASIRKTIKPVIYHLSTNNIHQIMKMIKNNYKTKPEITFLCRTNYLKRKLEDTLAPDQYNQKVMTVHASKGLEFRHVVIAGVSRDFFPHPNGDHDEEERIFYVAATRAMERLEILAWPDENNRDSIFLPLITRVAKNIYL